MFITSAAADISEGIGAGAAQRTSVEEIERALLRLAKHGDAAGLELAREAA